MTFRCAVCGALDLPSNINIEIFKQISLNMASSVTSREGNTTWHVSPPKNFYKDGNNPESKWDASNCEVSEDIESTSSTECTQQNVNDKAEETDQNDGAPSRSPKRHSQSVYERVKSKVSRSLSNGSVVQKLWMDSAPNSIISKSLTGSGVFRRPTSMVVDNTPGNEDGSEVSNSSEKCSGVDNNQISDEVNKNTQELSWTCVRCTLDNASTNERCEVCETPRKPRVPLLTTTGPRNSMVISVPDWVSADVKEVPITPSHVNQHSNQNTAKSSPAWSKPMYRRSLSEVPNTPGQLKSPSNRRSMVETDAQGNISVRSPVNNVNAQVPSRTRYSYIGLTEPTDASPTPVRHSVIGRKRILSPPTVEVAATSKCDNADVSSNSVNATPVSLQSPVLSQSTTSATSSGTSEISGLALKRMWTCTKCSYAYNPLWSDRCDICNSVRSPPSLNEPSLITVTKDSVRYTPTKQEGAGSSGKNKVPLPGTSATLAVEETDLEDDIEYLPSDETAIADADWTCKKCTLVNSASKLACDVCGGSKLRSITNTYDQTLPKGEFWDCPQCTLKNPLRAVVCRACKTANSKKCPDARSSNSSTEGSGGPGNPSPRQHISSRSNGILK